MNILINNIAVPVPSILETAWLPDASGTLLREITLVYNHATAAEAAILVNNAIKTDVPLSYINPATNANASLIVNCVNATMQVLRESYGVISYAPIKLILREVST